MADAPARQKIAVIGGGVGAMTTVFELTEQPGWADKYEITVYQMGWRLGGKGASGRNQAMGDRIEEHGVHFWFGYYENAFNLIQRVYAELGRRPDEPLATWRDAFKPHELFILMQFHAAQWSQWDLRPPRMPGVPGDGEIPTFWKLVDRLLEALHRHSDAVLPDAVREALHAPAQHPGWLRTLGERLLLGAEHFTGALGFHATREVVRRLAEHPDDQAAHDALHDALAAFGHFLERAEAVLDHTARTFVDDEAESSPILRRVLSLLTLGYYMFKGIVMDDVAKRGFDQLDHLDLREWLHSHGAGPLALDSDTIRVAYESIFAFDQGAYSRPNLAAGTGLRGLLRLSVGYKEAFSYKMQAGMGDTIFAPFYQVLKRRGVSFEFFSAVRSIRPSADGLRIESIEVGRQATIVGGGEYQPLYDVKGLPCWPSKPLFDQLVERDTLRDPYVNLESYWCAHPDVRTDTLHLGQDFDRVLLATSLGPIALIAPELVAQKPAWQAMVDNVQTIGTQAFQIWTRQDDQDLRRATNGDEPLAPGEMPIYGGFAQPHNTVADMSHLLARETWPNGTGPEAIYYACGPLSLARDMQSRDDIGFPIEQDAAAHTRACQWLRTSLQFLLPGAMYHGYPQSFPNTLDFGQLYDPDGPRIPASLHFDAQFWRANIDPSERYVLSGKGTTSQRVRAGQTGYDNLVLAGDFTFTALNYGCVEAAVMSGMEAASAICGVAIPIAGANFPFD